MSVNVSATMVDIATGTSHSQINILALIILFSIIFMPTFIVAQIFILRCKNKRLGLILPFIYFIVSLVPVGMMVVNAPISYDNLLLSALFMLIILNIPTGILLLMMYIKGGKDKQKKNEVDISKIKDLD